MGMSELPQKGASASSFPHTKITIWTKSESADHPLRKSVRATVETELRARHPQRQDWQEKCSDMATQLEQVLFKAANSFEEYANPTTISVRLAQIALSKREKKYPGVPLRLKKDNSEYQILQPILEKGRTEWLSSGEVSTAFDVLGNMVPTNELYACHSFNEGHPLQQLNGKVYHLWAHALRDGHIWSSESPLSRSPQLILGGSPIAQVILSSPDGKSKIWMIPSVDLTNTLERRVYSHADYSGSILVHYRGTSPASVSQPSHHAHYSNCLCLDCKFQLFHSPGPQPIEPLLSPVSSAILGDIPLITSPLSASGAPYQPSFQQLHEAFYPFPANLDPLQYLHPSTMVPLEHAATMPLFLSGAITPEPPVLPNLADRSPAAMPIAAESQFLNGSMTGAGSSLASVTEWGSEAESRRKRLRDTN